MLDLAPKSSQIARTAHGGRELLVAVHDLSKRYGRATVVADVTLALWSGEICGFVGSNGAGKTTILRMLAGILKPDGGGGQVLGFDLRRDAEEIRERVGYMSQRLSLYPELSVFENLRFRAATYGLRNPCAAAESALCEFGLVPWAGSAAGSLSGGWARRLQLAASLLHSPRLVLLDEPTAGLDAVALRTCGGAWNGWRRQARASLYAPTTSSRRSGARTPPFRGRRTRRNRGRRTRVAVFLMCGTGVRRLAKDVTAVAGVLASSPEGESLRVVAYPLAEPDLRRFAATRAASLARLGPRLDDAVLARSLLMGRQQT